MANADLSAARAREVLDYDPLTGVFTRRVRLAQRHQVGDRADFVVTSGNAAGYRRVSVDGKRYLAHRVAWLMVHGEWPENLIDHKNGIKSDNAIENLRPADHKLNNENQRGPRSDGTSGYLGVHWSTQANKWHARVWTNGRSIHVGYFNDTEEAYAAYVAAKRKIHKGCTL